MYTKPLLGILFLFSILLLPSTLAVFPEEDSFWEHDQIQPATETHNFCQGAPNLIQDSNGTIYIIHEKGCWVTDFIDNSIEVFRSTDLSTYTSIFEGLSGEDFNFQIRYNDVHDEVYACAFQETFGISRWFFFFHASNGTTISGPNILEVGGVESPGKTCSMSHTTNEESTYNIVRCRDDSSGFNVTHTLHNTIDYAESRNAPPGTSRTDEFTSGSTEEDVCRGQVLLDISTQQTNSNSTRWVYYSKDLGIRQRGCTWQFNSEFCTSSFARTYREQPVDRLLPGYFAAYPYNDGILTALTTTTQETASDGLTYALHEIYVDLIEWGAPNKVFQNLLVLSDAHNTENPHGKKTFGYSHGIFAPCIYAQDNIILLAYEAFYLNETDVIKTRIIVHSSRDGGQTWFAPSVVIDEGDGFATPLLSRKGNCITYSESTNQAVIGYVVGGNVDSTVGGAWVAHTDLDNLNITQTRIDRTLPIPEGTIGDGTQFMSVPLQPIADAWGIPLSSIQWLTGIIVVMVVVASIVTVGVLAVPIALVLGVGWMFVSGLFPVWLIVLVGFLLSLLTAMVFFGGES